MGVGQRNQCECVIGAHAVSRFVLHARLPAGACTRYHCGPRSAKADSCNPVCTIECFPLPLFVHCCNTRQGRPATLCGALRGLAGSREGAAAAASGGPHRPVGLGRLWVLVPWCVGSQSLYGTQDLYGRVTLCYMLLIRVTGCSFPKALPTGPGGQGRASFAAGSVLPARLGRANAGRAAEPNPSKALRVRSLQYGKLSLRSTVPTGGQWRLPQGGLQASPCPLTGSCSHLSEQGPPPPEQSRQSPVAQCAT